MTDNMRDRIAAALYRNAAAKPVIPWLLWEDTFPVVREVWLEMADAVIAELGLQAQHLDRASCVGNKPAIRYVTEWEADDECDRADRSYCIRCGIPHQPGVCRREDHT